MSDTEGTVPREKYREVLDQRNQFKNMWHNKCEELEGYKEFQSVSNENLRELIKEWRAKSEWHQERAIKDGSERHASSLHTFIECANDLEAVLEE